MRGFLSEVVLAKTTGGPFEGSLLYELWAEARLRMGYGQESRGASLLAASDPMPWRMAWGAKEMERAHLDPVLERTRISDAETAAADLLPLG